MFGNPADLSPEEPPRIETGLMGMSSGLSPYVVFGAAAGARSAYAIGYWYDARPGDPGQPLSARQALRFGEAWEFLPWAAAGASVQVAGMGAGLGERGFGIDADLGLRTRLGKAAYMGLAAHDLLESGLGPKEGFAVRRNYAASLAVRLDGGEEEGGSFFQNPEGGYAVQSRGSPSAGAWIHAFSLAAAFFPEGRLGLRGTVALTPAGSPGAALGTLLNFPLDRGVLSVAYVFGSGPGLLTGESGPAHSLSLGFRLGEARDRRPPWVEVEAVRPPGRVEGREFYFRLRAGDAPGPKPGAAVPDPGDGRIRAWALTVNAVDGNGALGKTVRGFRGKDLPPRAIRWDGSDSRGRPLSSGFYAYRFRAEDASGNSAVTVWRMLRLDRTGAAAPGGADSTRMEIPTAREPDSGPERP